MSGGLETERLAILVHEVRSPVAALAAVAETAAEPSGDAAVRRELVRLALAACRAIERLVLDASAASVRLERLDASSLVRDVVAAHGVRGSSVAGQVDDDLVVDGDPVRLRQALDNVIANALGHGGGAEVSVRAESDEGTVGIAVTDAGPGIPADELERIFDVGARLSDERPGSGLGLPLARAIAEAHGGSLVVSSAPGEGATFVIVLPAAGHQPATTASSS
jgi:signal transduction histidine kinase